MVKTFLQLFFVKKPQLLFTNYLSFTPLSYKNGLVKTLIHRTFKICSNWCLALSNTLKKTHTQRILLTEKLKRILKSNLILNHLSF